ncbi:glycine-betaine binding ABC transporter permease [Caballeronia hypogeia]|uniref:Glycine-betaine binding ABC transporter permease n=1 Tax=Caballeronia hypogeia TaxID=1777140 RepID=A0A158CZ66_9BURK|nr:ABC transporter permease subunit [Caballeronia hypogeia]SAK87655.1 glycine-betaine binding ABC transporter permease [Caballeronia hypogeia]
MNGDAMASMTEVFDAAVDNSLAWLTDHATNVFNGLSFALNGAFNGINAGLTFVPWWMLILVAAVCGWRFIGRTFAVTAVIGLWLCQAMGLWAETMSTLTLVFSSTLLALAVAIPAGIVLGLGSRSIKGVEVVLDFLQTMPPYIYLLPGIALLGYGPATAMWATWIVAIPPALRLTAHGVRMTPIQFRELGTAVGMTVFDHLFKIRVPMALTSIFAGINQSLMLSFGMVVIAGIAGSGGLGQAIYDAVRTLQIDKAVNAGIAIVVVTIVLDRFSQRLGQR